MYPNSSCQKANMFPDSLAMLNIQLSSATDLKIIGHHILESQTELVFVYNVIHFLESLLFTDK